MILYPTETIYGIGVNALDDEALGQLFALKGRDERQTVSWLVRDLEDIKKYAEVSKTVEKIAEQFLPGPLTLVLPAKDTVPQSRQASDGTVGFRISSDPMAQKLIREFWSVYNAPLTCTSANISGMSPASTPAEIIAQFSTERKDFEGFSRVIDGGKRQGAASTVLRVIGDQITVIREGSLTEEQIRAVL